MTTFILAQFAAKLARFGKEAYATWREARQLRRQLSGPADE
jgi:hypothetical protein